MLAAKNSRNRIEARSPTAATRAGTDELLIIMTELLMDFVPVNFVTGGFQLAPELGLPVLLVERDVNHTIEVRRQFDVALDQSGNPLRAYLADEKSKLENNVLASSRVQIDGLVSLTQIVRRHQHHGKPDAIRFLAEFRYERPPLVRPLVQNNRLETEFFDKPRDLCFGHAVVAVD